MLSQSHRFHGRASLKRLNSRGASVRGGYLAVRYEPNSRRSAYRAAVVVSRKVSKSAVVRNRIRRRLYENVRILYGNSIPVYDIALFVYDASVAELPQDDLRKEVEKLLTKAGILPKTTSSHAIVDAKDS